MGSKARTVSARWARTVAGLVGGWLMVMLLAQSAAAAEVYRWVDEHGRVHFSDRPQRVGQKPLQVTPTAPSEDRGLEQRQQRRDRLLRIFSEDREREQAARKQQEIAQAQRQRDCQLARNELADLERGGVFYQLGEHGERRYLHQDDVNRRKAHWRAEVKRLCESQ